MSWAAHLYGPPAHSQFPDDQSFVDKVVVGLICTAVALPFTLVLSEVFTVSGEPEFPELQLTWPITLKALFVTFKQRWNWAEVKPGKAYVMSARFIHEGFTKILVELFMQHAVEPAQAWLEERLGCGESESESSESSESEASGSGRTESNTGDTSARAGGSGGECWQEHNGDSASPYRGGVALRVQDSARHVRIVPNRTGPRSGGQSSRLHGLGERAAAGPRELRRMAREERAAVNDGLEAEKKRKFLLKLALALVYSAWAVIVWIIFVYGD